LLSQYDTRAAAVKAVNMKTCQQMTQRTVIGRLDLKVSVQKYMESFTNVLCFGVVFTVCAILSDDRVQC